MPLLSTGFPNIRVFQDVELYPYSPITQPNDVEKLLRPPFGQRRNPFLLLPERPPFVPEDKVTMGLRFEVRPPAEATPRFFQAIIKSGPDRLSLPLDHKVMVDVFDRYSYNIYPDWRSQKAFLHTIASYRKLEHLQGKVIPRYYGSFVMVLPYYTCTKLKTREILVVLREYIDGIFMDNRLLRSYPREDRQAMMEKVIEAEHAIDSSGVSLAFSRRAKSFVVVKKGQSFHVIVWLFAFTALDPTASNIINRPGSMPFALLKWKEHFFKSSYRFGKFVDWPWVPWLYEKYGHELDHITKEQIKLVGGLDEEGVKKHGKQAEQENSMGVDEKNKRQNKDVIGKIRQGGRVAKQTKGKRVSKRYKCEK
ncbi:hypothetical protein TRVA0_030S01354 [Trichomonascus vanleenenianus]|uniref:uncharacterized protein n=1 Tax=Trichomonascus vanleenenianus TaxID=2268995 RepID=UPI003EC9B8EC